MTTLHSILLGIVEGFTEFLPISSTGHLILASRVLGLNEGEFLKTFEIVIQLGAMCAVVLYYFKILFKWDTIKKLFVAFLPTAIAGLLLYKFAKMHLLGNATVVVAALFVGGIILIVFEYFYKRKTRGEHLPMRLENLSYKNAILIGVFQILAIIPGVSRSGATILGGLALGLERGVIVEFSFLLAVPTILAASGLDLVKNYTLITSDNFGLLAAGFVTSFVVAILSIRFLLAFARKHDFIVFGIYRILLSAAFYFLFL